MKHKQNQSYKNKSMGCSKCLSLKNHTPLLWFVNDVFLVFTWNQMYALETLPENQLNYYIMWYLMGVSDLLYTARLHPFSAYLTSNYWYLVSEIGIWGTYVSLI